MNLSKKKIALFVSIGLVTIISVAIYINLYLYRTQAQIAGTSVNPTGTYTSWYWPSKNYTNFEWTVVPYEEQIGPDAYFYSHQFGLVNGAGGYSGIQGDSNGKRAIFSIWDALGAEGPGKAQTFGGEGEGWQTVIDYNWIAGRSYKFNLKLDSIGRNGTWWSATITDQQTGISSFIGKIQVPSSWQFLDGYSLVWTERYGGALSRCSDIHYSSVEFKNFTANSGGIVPSSHNNHLTQPEGCPGSLVTDTTQGVKHEVGIGNPVPGIIRANGVDTYLSNISWTFATTGYGSIQKDQTLSADGKIITLNSQRYEKGIATHANSEIRYDLARRYSRFKSDVGIDEDVGGLGSVSFEVWVDGQRLFDSGIMTGNSETKSIDIDITGKNELKLIVKDGGDNINFDHADFANARLLSSSGSNQSPTSNPSPTPTPTSAPTPTPTAPQPTPTAASSNFPTSISIYSYLNPSTFGGSSYFLTSINPSSCTGTVDLYVDGKVKDSKNTSGGSLVFIVNGLSRGNHEVYAQYSGSSNCQGSRSLTITQNVR